MMNSCEKPRQIVFQEQYGYQIKTGSLDDFISVFFLNHNLARFFTRIHHHEHPFYFYLEVLALGMYPWAVTALLAPRGRRTEGPTSQPSTFRIRHSGLK